MRRGPGGRGGHHFELAGSLPKPSGEVQVPGRAALTCACSAPWGNEAEQALAGTRGNTHLGRQRADVALSARRWHSASARPAAAPPHPCAPAAGRGRDTRPPPRPPAVKTRVRVLCGFNPEVPKSCSAFGLLLFLQSFIMKIVNQKNRKNSMSTYIHFS